MNGAEVDPEAEMVKQDIRRNLTVIDEFHKVVTDDGRKVYARIHVMASEAHPLPLELLDAITGALQTAWLEGRERAQNGATKERMAMGGDD